MIDLFDQTPDPGQDVPDWLSDLVDAMRDEDFRRKFITTLRDQAE
jgi:hypothetical protein